MQKHRVFSLISVNKRRFVDLDKILLDFADYNNFCYNTLVHSYEYFFSEKLEIATEVAYSFIINHKNVQGDFKQGFEFKFAISHKLF